MMRSFINLRAAELYPFLISLVGHLTIAQLFVFTFNSKPIEFKPSFIFLGPLLRENDFRNLAATKAAANPQTSPAITIKNLPNAFESTRHVPKPAFLKDSPQQGKTFLKSSFVKPFEEPANKAQNLGINVTVPERVPLKLDLK